MGSKTRLSCYCTKRANNGVNLVTSRKINTRLARRILEAFHQNVSLGANLRRFYENTPPGRSLCQKVDSAVDSYPQFTHSLHWAYPIMLFTPQNKMPERKRKPNYSVDEVNEIVCMVEEHNDVIRCKFMNTITNTKKEDVCGRELLGE